METKALEKRQEAVKMNWRKISIWSLIIAGSALSLYYLWTRAFMFFDFSQEVYTDYFWFRSPWLLAHVILGSIALLVGPFQFIPSLRRN
ncbi:MAG: hypothetical protein AAFO69_20275, partial [Bacteroidota bacterium]